MGEECGEPGHQAAGACRLLLRPPPLPWAPLSPHRLELLGVLSLPPRLACVYLDLCTRCDPENLACFGEYRGKIKTFQEQC